MNAKRAGRKLDRGVLHRLVDALSDGVLLTTPGGTIVWANEAALGMHACATLAELGGTAAQYRARFRLSRRNRGRLEAHQYPIDRMLAGHEIAGLVVDLTRRGIGNPSRTVEIRSLVLVDDAGAPESIAFIYRDLAALREAEERFERIFEAKPAPALICRLRDQRYLKVNDGFLELCGYRRESIVGRSFQRFDVLAGAACRDEALAAFAAWRTIPQQEAVLAVRGATGRSVIVAGQPIEFAGEECMLFTFVDLEPSKQAERTLRDSEERFARVFRLAPVPMVVCVVAQWRVLMVNDAFVELVERPREDIKSQSFAAATGLRGSRTLLREVRDRLAAGRNARDLEVQLRRPDARRVYCLLSAEPVMLQGQSCALLVVEDVTERKRSEMDLLAALDAVMADPSWFSRMVMEKLAQQRHPAVSPDSDTVADLTMLTPREHEVLALVCKGMTDPEIAAELALSRNTVRNHVASIYDKIGVHRRSAAVVWGRERGLAGY